MPYVQLSQSFKNRNLGLYMRGRGSQGESQGWWTRAEFQINRLLGGKRIWCVCSVPRTHMTEQKLTRKLKGQVWVRSSWVWRDSVLSWFCACISHPGDGTQSLSILSKHCGYAYLRWWLYVHVICNRACLVELLSLWSTLRRIKEIKELRTWHAWNLVLNPQQVVCVNQVW